MGKLLEKKSKMTSVRLKPSNHKYIKENKINLSKFLEKKIEEKKLKSVSKLEDRR